MGKNCDKCSAKVKDQTYYKNDGLCERCVSDCFDKHCVQCGKKITLKTWINRLGICFKCRDTRKTKPVSTSCSSSRFIIKRAPTLDDYDKLNNSRYA